jgi:RNA polymerase sigma factor (sigma-70 family)
VSVAALEYRSIEGTATHWPTLTPEQSRIVAAHHAMAIAIARHHSVRYSSSAVGWEDLAQEATLGLTVAARRWDPDRGIKFATYARHVVTGHILDYLRTLDHLTPSHRAKLRSVGGGDHAPGRPLSLDVLVDALGTDLLVHVDDHSDWEDQQVAAAFIAYAKRSPWFTERMSQVVTLHLAGQTMAEVAENLGIAESRVSHLFKLFRLRARAWGAEYVDSTPAMTLEES